MFIYIVIFLSKVLENAIATLRIIVITNGKKVIGAILQGIVAIIWICVTGIVVVDILKDPLKIVAFSLGTAVGSFLGSILEEKIALGNNLLTIIVDKNNENKITEAIEKNELIVTTTNCQREKSILFVLLPRKKIKLIIKIVKCLDEKALVISENAFNTYGNFFNN